MVGILVSFWDGLFSGAFAVSFREGIWLLEGSTQPAGGFRKDTPFAWKMLEFNLFVEPR